MIELRGLVAVAILAEVLSLVGSSLATHWTSPPRMRLPMCLGSLRACLLAAALLSVAFVVALAKEGEEASGDDVAHGGAEGFHGLEGEHHGGEGEHHGSAHHGGEHHGGHHGFDGLYLPMGFLLVGTAILQLQSFRCLRAVPPNVLFFLAGALFGVLASLDTFKTMESLHRSYTSWSQINPHHLMFTFLPPLVFAEAYNLDAHLANRTFGQCLILAGHGAILTAFAIAAVYHLFLYQWDLSICIMMGSILASTDAGVVVEILEELGASPVLIMRIRGESMLSDGTVLVLFHVAQGLIAFADSSPVEIAEKVLMSFFGAFVVGGVVGLVFLYAIRSASDRLQERNSWIQIMLTIVCAYWSFILAEGVLHMSGVVSTVAAGSVLARHMWPAIVCKEAMREFWSVATLICKMLVFFLAGMLCGKTFTLHTPEDYLLALASYVAMNLIRLVVVSGLWCPLNVVGQRLRKRDLVALWCAGLKGIVALCLGIVVSQGRADGHLDDETAQKILFHVGSNVLLTLVINATTAPWLFNALGVTQTGEGRKTLVRHVARRARRHLSEALKQSIEGGQLPAGCGIGAVCKTVEELNADVKRSVNGDRKTKDDDQCQRDDKWHEQLVEPDVHALWTSFKEHKVALLPKLGSLGSFKLGGQLGNIKRLIRPDKLCARQLTIVRDVFLESVRASYWEQGRSGRFGLGANDLKLLIDSIDMAKPKCSRRLADWSILKQDLRFDPSEPAEFERDLRRHSGQDQAHAELERKLGFVGKCWRQLSLRKSFGSQLTATYVIEAFVRAHERAQAEVAAYFGHDGSIDSGEEAFVILESQISVFAASAVHASIAKPVKKCLTTTQESVRLCTVYRNFVLAAHEQGVLRSAEAEQLMEPVAESLRHLTGRLKRASGDLLQELGGGTQKAMHQVEAAVMIQRAYRRWQMLCTVRHLGEASKASHARRRYLTPQPAPAAHLARRR